MHQNASADDPHVLRTIEAGIYERLTRPDEQWPWAVRELVLEIGDPLDVEDALATCTGSGWSIAAVSSCGLHERRLQLGPSSYDTGIPQRPPG